MRWNSSGSAMSDQSRPISWRRARSRARGPGPPRGCASHLVVEATCRRRKARTFRTSCGVSTGFCEEVVRARVVALAHGRGVAEGGQHDDGQRGAVRLADAHAGLEAVEAGQADVEQHEVARARRRASRGPPRRSPRACPGSRAAGSRSRRVRATWGSSSTTRMRGTWARAESLAGNHRSRRHVGHTDRPRADNARPAAREGWRRASLARRRPGMGQSMRMRSDDPARAAPRPRPIRGPAAPQDLVGVLSEQRRRAAVEPRPHRSGGSGCPRSARRPRRGCSTSSEQAARRDLRAVERLRHRAHAAAGDARALLERREPLVDRAACARRGARCARSGLVVGDAQRVGAEARVVARASGSPSEPQNERHSASLPTPHDHVAVRGLEGLVGREARMAVAEAAGDLPGQQIGGRVIGERGRAGSRAATRPRARPRPSAARRSRARTMPWNAVMPASTSASDAPDPERRAVRRCRSRS